MVLPRHREQLSLRGLVLYPDCHFISGPAKGGLEQRCPRVLVKVFKTTRD
ncbi:hypothetical protein OAX78_01205 [Planctomycetota bacterium]|nr:hypothetical protein [Planctomycetota bacterium]